MRAKSQRWHEQRAYYLLSFSLFSSCLITDDIPANYMNASPPQCSFLVVKRCNCQNKITFLTAAKFNSCDSLCSPPIIRQPEAEEERLLATDSSYASVQKFGVGKIFVMFIKKVSYAHQGCMYLFQNTVKSVMLQNIVSIQNYFIFEYISKCNLFLL